MEITTPHFAQIDNPKNGRLLPHVQSTECSSLLTPANTPFLATAKNGSWALGAQGSGLAGRTRLAEPTNLF